MRGRFVFPVLALVAFLLPTLPACQDYGFEELPSSVIKEKRTVTTINVASEIDLLFVVDNSGSMVGEQKALAASFQELTQELDLRFGANKYQIGLITTGMESTMCPRCSTLPQDPPPGSCMNDTGENGRFQDRIGIITAEGDPPTFEFTTNRSCRIVTSGNTDCFFDQDGGGLYGGGIVLVGTNGCGYEKGLEPIRIALAEPLITSYNAKEDGTSFLRDAATLGIIIVSDEDDCGRRGDVTEPLGGVGARVCYYASKGVAPDGAVADSTGKPFTLEPVSATYDFLMGLKDNRSGAVKFAAVVGVTDPSDPGSTEITYESEVFNAEINAACYTPDCGTDDSCKAYPGTRYIELAEMFGLGENGLVDTICQRDFSETMKNIGTFVSCPEIFNLSEPILDPALANILLNDVTVPRYSCAIEGVIEECTGTDDTTCSSGTCVPTWNYAPPTEPPDPMARGGQISFAEHYKPCDLITEGEIRFEVVYVTP